MIPPPPSTWIRIRHSIGRALRETGQALDRVGVLGIANAQSHRTVNDPPSILDVPLSRHRNLMPLLRRGEPVIGMHTFIAPCATLIGSVRIGEQSSVWYGAVLRADVCSNGMGRQSSGEQIVIQEEEWLSMPFEMLKQQDGKTVGNAAGGAIFIGERSNIQDGAIISSRVGHTIIGDGVTVGHCAQIHSATIGSNTLVGMRSILCPNSHVENFSFVAAGAVVRSGVTVPSGELWVGNPARKLRDLSENEKNKLIYQANEYVKVGTSHMSVMELGGNVPDIIIADDPLIASGEENSSTISEGGKEDIGLPGVREPNLESLDEEKRRAA